MAVKPLGSLSEVKMEEVTPAPAPGASTPPYMTQTEREAAAGRARVLEHEGRERMLAAARASETPEAERVANATKANADL